MDEITHSPISGRKFDLVTITGDLIENSQYNELQSIEQILNGQIVQPFLATLEIWQARLSEELQGQAEMLWNLALAGKKLKLPILISPGNHDLLGTGFMQHSWFTHLWAAQPFKFLPARDFCIEDFETLWRRVGQGNLFQKLRAWLELAKFGPSIKKNSKLVKSRFDMSRSGVTREHFEKIITHFGKELNIQLAGSAYYSCRLASGVTFVMLDTVSTCGSSFGQITQEQFDWFRSELVRAERNQELVVVVTHHPAEVLTEKKQDPRSRKPPILKQGLLDLLANSPAVIAHLSGHIHQNRITYRPKSGGGSNGYWEIVTSSFSDFPQQFRMIELLREHDGNFRLSTRMINHSASLDAVLGDPEACSNRELCDYCASVGRRLAYSDRTIGHHSPDGAIALGTAEDRNADLFVRDPYAKSYFALARSTAYA